MRVPSLFAATALLGLALPAIAQTPADAPGAATAKVAPVTPAPVAVKMADKKSKRDPNRMICKTLGTTGSRLKPNKDCRTAQQWDADAALERRDLDKIQSNRYNGNSGM